MALAPAFYPPPYTRDHFYLVPVTWLRGVSDAGDWDTRELLLAQVWDGQIIFTQPPEEQQWVEDSDDRRRFFSRQTYSRHKNTLLRLGLLQKFLPPPRTTQVSLAVHRELYQGVKYAVSDWPPPFPLFYRPLSYLQQRWPVWLGNSDTSSRAILLAFFEEAAHHATQPASGASTSLPPTITRTWQQIQRFVSTQLTTGQGDQAAALLDKLRKGVEELLLLAVLQEEEGYPLRYSLQLTHFQEKPCWRPQAMAQACKLDWPQQTEWVLLLRDLMLHCWEPVTRLQTVWHALAYHRQTPYLQESADLFDLQKHIRLQRRDRPPRRYHELLDDYLQKRQGQGLRLLSPSFQLPAQALAQASNSLSGELLRMPVTTAHGINATQLAIHCQRASDLTVAETQEILAATHFIVWQEKEEQDPVAVPLTCPPPKALSIDYGFIVRANQLHQRLDYSRPFTVIIKCNRPDPRLHLTCCFRLLLANAPDRAPQKKQTKR